MLAAKSCASSSLSRCSNEPKPPLVAEACGVVPEVTALPQTQS